MWVANQFGNTVTELSASTGALIQVLSASSCPGCQFAGPDAISSDGASARRKLGLAHVWVAN